MGKKAFRAKTIPVEARGLEVVRPCGDYRRRLGSEPRQIGGREVPRQDVTAAREMGEGGTFELLNCAS
jgi:hypothetical protein